MYVVWGEGGGKERQRCGVTEEEDELPPEE